MNDGVVDNQLLLMALAALVNHKHGGLVEIPKAELEVLDVCDVAWGYDSEREVLVLKVSNRTEHGTDTGE
jgi:hypothetical protein